MIIAQRIFCPQESMKEGCLTVSFSFSSASCYPLSEKPLSQGPSKQKGVSIKK